MAVGDICDDTRKGFIGIEHLLQRGQIAKYCIVLYRTDDVRGFARRETELILMIGYEVIDGLSL